MARDVFDVGHVFVAAFDFEAAHTRIDQGSEVLALVVVFHREHMLVVGDKAALRVGDVIGQTASLAAVTSVGATACVGMADETLAAISDAQSPMHKELELAALGIEHVVDGFDLLKRQLTGQHNL